MSVNLTATQEQLIILDSLYNKESIGLNITLIQKEILNKVLESRNEQFVPPPTNYQANVWLTLLINSLGNVSNSLINLNEGATYHDELIALGACVLGALEDYYEGTQDLSLDSLYCAVDYLKEQEGVVLD